MVSIDKFKLSSVVWDSDKNPTGFTKWMSDFSALVASTEHGATLEKFLDEKLGRQKHHSVTVPSYITGDDDFDDPPPAQQEQAQMQEGEGQAPPQEDVVSSSVPPKLGSSALFPTGWSYLWRSFGSSTMGPHVGLVCV